MILKKGTGISMKKVWMMAAAAASALTITACATTDTAGDAASSSAAAAPAESTAQPYAGVRTASYEADRQAILAMAGDFGVTFDFTETVALKPGYELAPQKVTPTTEIVRVIEDRPGFISLQHILVMNHDGQDIVVKHWRQDWRYEPETVLSYVGPDPQNGRIDRWEAVPVPRGEREGAWSQTVYQVDDSPRYAAVARWEHDGALATWEPPVSWHPLPRRDDTKRDDYNVLAAVNRHTVASWGWWHEQDNHKLNVTETGIEELVREVGINSYIRADSFDASPGEAYWDKTETYWAGVRDIWTAMEETGALTVEDTPEGELLYMPVLELAGKVESGEMTAEAALAEAETVIDARTTDAAETQIAAN